MAVLLQMNPKASPMSWRELCTTHPRHAIAIDGYVRCGPRYNKNGPYLNLNHHEGVSRLETRATCAQALMLVRMGLFNCFCDQGIPHALIYANDCDEDVCLTWTILNQNKISREVINPILNRLVHMEDMLDTTSGAYPFSQQLHSLHELAWVFEPYRLFRVSGNLDRRNADEFSNIVFEVEARIIELLKGQGKEIPLHTEYRIIRQGTGWTMLEEIGSNARAGIFSDGIVAFVSVRQRPDGKWVYTGCRNSIFIPVPLQKIVKAANKREGNGIDLWGGSELVIGSPRVSGSEIRPDEFFTIFEKEVRKTQERSKK